MDRKACYRLRFKKVFNIKRAIETGSECNQKYIVNNENVCCRLVFDAGGYAQEESEML